MKELSIEEKAERYDKAFGIARNVWRFSSNNAEIMRMEELFPELKVSEDEEVRKIILDQMKCWNEDAIQKNCEIDIEASSKCIAWLEKQEGCEHIRKDWLEHIKQSWYKEGFIDGKYSGVKEWTINDDATLKELIDFLENGKAILQHDLTHYANWLKIKFTPKKHLE